MFEHRQELIGEVHEFDAPASAEAWTATTSRTDQPRLAPYEPSYSYWFEDDLGPVATIGVPLIAGPIACVLRLVLTEKQADAEALACDAAAAQLARLGELVPHLVS